MVAPQPLSPPQRFGGEGWILKVPLFNEIVPQDLGFVDRSTKGNELKLEIDFLVGKKELKRIIVIATLFFVIAPTMLIFHEITNDLGKGIINMQVF